MQTLGHLENLVKLRKGMEYEGENKHEKGYFTLPMWTGKDWLQIWKTKLKTKI